MELVEAEVNGLEIMLDALRYDEQDHIWLISMAGQNTAIRGAWASLLQGSFLAIPKTGQRLSIADTSAGWVNKSSRVGDPRRLGRSFGHLILLPPCTDPWSASPEILIVHNDTTPPETTLMRFLANRSSVPLDDAWAPQLWRWANIHEHITQLAGHGPAAWLAQIPDTALLNEFMPQIGTA